MARTSELGVTWNERLQRWQRKHKGRKLYFKFPKDRPDLALDAFRATVESEERYSEAIEQNQRLLEWANRTKSPNGARAKAAAEAELNRLVAERDSDKPPLLTAPPDLYAEFLKWREQQNTPQKKIPSASDPTIAALVDKFLEVRKADCSVGCYTKERSVFLRFKKWVGNKRVSELNEDLWESFYLFLVKEVKAGKFSRDYAKTLTSLVRSLIRYLFEKRLCELPRNFNAFSKRKALAVTPKKVSAWSNEEIAQLFAVSNGKQRLWWLLMLNTAMTQGDIAALKKSEIDLEAGTITRKRTKTKDEANVPEVCYRLWPETLELLKEHMAAEGDLALLNEDGKPLKQEWAGGRYDGIALCFRRNIRTKFKTDKQLKQLRKTGPSRLAEHPTYGRFSQYFLGHAPETTADKHYVVPPQKLFDEAVAWLNASLDIAKVMKPQAAKTKKAASQQPQSH